MCVRELSTSAGGQDIDAAWMRSDGQQAASGASTTDQRGSQSPSHPPELTTKASKIAVSGCQSIASCCCQSSSRQGLGLLNSFCRQRQAVGGWCCLLSCCCSWCCVSLHCWLQHCLVPVLLPRGRGSTPFAPGYGLLKGICPAGGVDEIQQNGKHLVDRQDRGACQLHVLLDWQLRRPDALHTRPLARQGTERGSSAAAAQPRTSSCARFWQILLWRLRSTRPPMTYTSWASRLPSSSSASAVK